MSQNFSSEYLSNFRLDRIDLVEIRFAMCLTFVFAVENRSMNEFKTIYHDEKIRRRRLQNQRLIALNIDDFFDKKEKHLDRVFNENISQIIGYESSF